MGRLLILKAKEDVHMETIVVAAIAFMGTLAGTFGGIITANRLTNYRIEQLEKKVDKHNTVIERTYALEQRCSVIETKLELED